VAVAADVVGMTHHHTFVALSAAFAMTLSACVHDVADPEGHGDDAPELNFFGDEIVDHFTADDGLLISPPLSGSAPANQVALMGELSLVASNGVDSDEIPVVLVRAVGTSQWQEAEWTFAETNGESTLVAGRGVLDGEVDAVEIAIHEDSADFFTALTFAPAFIDTTEAIDAVSAEALEQSDALAPELAFVGVVPRNVWGARAHRCSTRDNGYSRVALHHSASNTGSDAFAAARQIQAYHMDGRGYCDAGYHFAVAQDGRVLELRPLPFRGGHTLNNNSNNVGVVFLGCFHSTCGNQQPTDALIGSGAGMLVMMNMMYGVPIISDRVRGHRDHSGAQTACPGNNLYARLGEIRQRALDQLNGGGGGGGDQPAPPPAPPPPSGCGIVGANTALAPGEGTHSCSGRFFFVHQTDGNVVLYDNGHAIWSTSTNGRSTSSLVMQGDGNVVLYSGSQALWSTGTNGHNGAVLAVQDDGNVVVYGPGNTPLWATGTNR
jgi:hypothetical protein